MGRNGKLIWHTEKRKVDYLIPCEHNPRRLTEKQYKDLKKSLETFDLAEIPAINTDNTIIAGHQRLRILQELGRGQEEIDVRVPSSKLTTKQVQEYNIRSNKNTGEWDFDILANEFEQDDLIDWGFEIEELIGSIEEEAKQGLTDDDDVPQATEPICKRGDLWKLGEHRLLCGDATVITDVERLMDGEKVDMVFTDPPFDMTETDYMPLCLAYTDGAILVMHSDANMVNLASEYREYFHYFLVHYYSFGFVRSNNMPQLAHHLIGVFGKSSFKSQKDGFKTVICEQLERGKLMPYQKRVEIPEACVIHYSGTGDIFDPFGGSGSTLIACEKLNRRCKMIEIEPHNCDIIINRWQDYTGLTAVICENPGGTH